MGENVLQLLVYALLLGITLFLAAVPAILVGGVAAAAISLENILSDAVPDGGVCRLDLGTPLGNLPKRSGEACDPGTAGEAEDFLGRVLFPAGPPFGPPCCGSGEWGERA